MRGISRVMAATLTLRLLRPNLGIRERFETLGLANMTLRAPIQAIGYSGREWRYAERGSFIDAIQRTGKVIYGNGKTRRKLQKR